MIIPQNMIWLYNREKNKKSKSLSVNFRRNNNTAIERDDSDENIEYVSFLNKKMDAISERIKESGDQQCMKKLLDIYAKYPVIQR